MAKSSGPVLSGKVVLITGAARGIGAETARRLARRGARLALVGLEPEELARVADELGPEHFWTEADVTDGESIGGAVTAAVEHFGRLDAVIANAGLAPLSTVRMSEPQAFRKTIDVNLNGVFETVHAALPHIIESRGYVLAVSSLSAFAPVAGMAAYTASKAGVEALASALHSEVAYLGVAVGSAHPSWVDTDLVRDASSDLPTFREMRAKLPWPMRSTTTVQACAEAMADGVQRRARRIYVPRAIMLMHWLRNLPASKLVSRLMAKTERELVPKMEREVAELGRQFSARNSRIQR
ncbi:SDR family oxidoreductase [Bounagaea algeriensis]